MSSDRSATSTVDDDDFRSFLEPRDPSITDPRMRPRPKEGKHLFEDEPSSIVEDDHLRVYLRIKPLSKKKRKGHRVESKNSLATLTRGNEGRVKNRFAFTHIFDEIDNDQRGIFDRVIKNDLQKFIEGQDFTVMTYGASGSGKTYTLMGTETEPGIVPRLLETLFLYVRTDRLPNYKPTDGNNVILLNSVEKEKEIQNIQWIVKNCTGDFKTGTVTDSERPDVLETYRRQSVAVVGDHRDWKPYGKRERRHDVWVSFAEIYNEAIFDLLREDPAIPNQPPARLRLVHAANDRAYIKGVRWIYVRNGAEAFAALERGRCRLRYAHTNVNKQSSRSHSVFFLRIVHYDSDLGDPQLSTFRLCDLAGSERAKKTGNEGLRLQESRKINSSLHVLEKCLCALRNRQEGQRAVPPYRESKLTSLLQNALSGNEAISMMVNINPDPLFIDETHHVLQFSAIAKEIVGYVEPEPEIIRRSRSFSDLLETSRELSELASEDSYLNEVEYLREEISRIKKEFEETLQQREKDLRNEIVNHFLKLMKQKHDEFEEKLNFDRKRHAECHAMEMSDKILEHREEVDTLTAEIDSLRKKVSNLEKTIDDLTAVQKNKIDVLTEKTKNMKITTSFDDQQDSIVQNYSSDRNDSKNSSGSSHLKDVSQKLNTTFDKSKQEKNCTKSPGSSPLKDVSQKLNTTFDKSKQEKNCTKSPGSSPLKDVGREPNETSVKLKHDKNCTESPVSDRENVPFNVENFCTIKKEKTTGLPIDELSSVTKSKRKLFCRREFDENAAEIVERAKTARELHFQDSPGDIKPPIVEKPYTIERPVRSTRSKRNKF